MLSDEELGTVQKLIDERRRLKTRHKIIAEIGDPKLIGSTLTFLATEVGRVEEALRALGVPCGVSFNDECEQQLQ